jgi:hypothetical protein
MGVYGSWVAQALGDYLSGKTVKALLVDETFTFEPDHQFRSSIFTEVSGSGYTPGGVGVTGVVVTYDAMSDRVVLNCDDVTFGLADIPLVGGIVFYVSTGVASADPLLAVDTFAPVEVTSAANLVYTVATGGLVAATLGTP